MTDPLICAAARPDLAAKGVDLTYGCLVLGHDVQMSGTTPYNTTDDLLSFLATDEEESYGDLTIATCFKSGHPCSNTALGNSWNTLVDNFFATSIDTTATITWVLDGDAKVSRRGVHASVPLPPAISPRHQRIVAPSQPNHSNVKPHDCNTDRWQPWNSTWINSEDEGALWSNDPEKGWHRFVVLNNEEDFTNWTWLASPSVNYGKFSAEGMDQAYQMW